MEQVQTFNPPPNPAKTTDSRFESYQKEFGNESWELDALPPAAIVEMIRQQVLSLRNEALWQAAVHNEERGRNTLSKIVEHFPAVVDLLRKLHQGAPKPAVLCADCGATTEAPWCFCEGRDLSADKKKLYSA